MSPLRAFMPPVAPAPPDDVLLIEDLARKLRTSPRTIARLIRSGRFPYPELPRLDKKRRWSRVVVDRILASALR